MNWTQSHDMLLATHNCARCHGAGRIREKKDRSISCGCVFRNIFRSCLRRFRHCVERNNPPSTVQLERTTGNLRRAFYSRRMEEYAADFYLVSRRVLTPEEFDLFKYHFLYGADHHLCCRRMNIEKGKFFHDIYRIQQTLGRVFRDLQPYPLFPLEDYFHNAGSLSLEELRSTIRLGEEEGPKPLTPPLATPLPKAA